MKRALLILLLSTLPLTAQEIREQAPGPEHYQALWENSPFTRPLNAAESYVVTGVIRIDQKPVVTMLNTATGERFPLTTQPNAHGWRLVELRNDPDPRQVMAVVSINGEEVAVRFNDQQLAPEALIRAAEPSRQRVNPASPRVTRSSPQRKPAAPPKKEKPKKRNKQKQ